MNIDVISKFVFTSFFFLWNIIEGSKIDTQYPHSLVVLYFYPLWRILLILTLIVASYWCHRLGMMMAFSIFFYFMDMQLLLYKEV
jgi:hypothetical protein